MIKCHAIDHCRRRCEKTLFWHKKIFPFFPLFFFRRTPPSPPFLPKTCASFFLFPLPMFLSLFFCVPTPKTPPRTSFSLCFLLPLPRSLWFRLRGFSSPGGSSHRRRGRTQKQKKAQSRGRGNRKKGVELLGRKGGEGGIRRKKKKERGQKQERKKQGKKEKNEFLCQNNLISPYCLIVTSRHIVTT